MDIRKWFTSSGPKASSTASESRSKNSSSPKKKTEKSSKKRRIIESDSDEEPIPQKEKNCTNTKSPKNPDIKKRLNSSNLQPEPKKEVSVIDFFGSAPISRTKQHEALTNKKIKEDVKIHEDKNFEECLKQLDSRKVEIKKEKINIEKKSNKEEKNCKEKEPHKEEIDKGKRPNKEQQIDREKKSPKEEKIVKDGEKGSKTMKRKSKMSESPKIEITPNSKNEKKQVIEEKTEKPAAKKLRGGGGANYASYLHREGPKALGSKEIPEGEENCLAGLTFIVTGVLESMERDEAKSLIEKYGGKVMTTLSKNTKYIVIGRDAGASKLEKAEKLGTKQLDEDGLLDLIKTLPGKNGSGKTKSSAKNSTKSPKVETLKEKDSLESSFLEDDDDDMFLNETLLTEERTSETVKESQSSKNDSGYSCQLEKSSEQEIKAVDAKESATVSKVTPVSTSMWVDKYKPSNIKQIIGQQGDNSNAKKLLRWLTNWKKNRRLNKKPIPSRFGGGDDGSGFKAALLSGCPGVGKTTTAQLVCKEAGYEYFELNASDTRSKKSLQQVVSQLLGNQTLGDCFKENVGKVSSNHVIIMDEVDGMAGNEDRGGMMELIGLIKTSKVPVICICNDRNHPKIRSLSNYCFDLRFQKPRVEQIKAAMMSIAFKEHIKVSSEALQDVIVASNQDVRQVLHNMSMWSAKSKNMTNEQTKKDISYGIKHVKLNPFDVLREVFAIGNNSKATLNDKAALFFHDYSIVPLFVQENYVHVLPTEAQGDKKKHLTLLSEASDSICIGDMIDRQIRNQNSWSLLPTQAIFASVIPGELLKGHLRQMINFPIWLGKNSNRSKMDRILQELHVHMRMKITGNKTDVNLDYLPLLRRALTKPLIDKEVDGIPDVLKTMENYYLLREDFDSIIDLSLWPQQSDPRTKIVTKVKSAFTRAYNKECGKNPYALTNVKKKKVSPSEVDNELDDENLSASEEEEEDNIEKDAMIKVKKPPKKQAIEKEEPSTSKGKKKNPSKRGGKTK